MLPYTPLHHLLMAAVARPIVCTSGNLSDEPMAIAIEEALGWMGPDSRRTAGARSADRPAGGRLDRSFRCRWPAGAAACPRVRSAAAWKSTRGDAGHWPTVLAVGGHLKNTVALALGRVRETTCAAASAAGGKGTRIGGSAAS